MYAFLRFRAAAGKKVTATLRYGWRGPGRPSSATTSPTGSDSWNYLYSRSSHAGTNTAIPMAAKLEDGGRIMVETTLHNDPEYIQFAHKEPHPTLLKHVRRFWPLRSSARRMIPLLANSKKVNPLGFATTQERRKGTLLDFICSEKERFPDKVLLVRVGEFYEAFGFDAILLVEHCGLNPMGSKARAGFPLKNIQQTLDGLTDVGLSVAVYEEDGKDAVMPQSTSGRKRSQSKAIKTRFLSQIISPGSSTYIYNSALRTDDIEYKKEHPT